MPVRTLKRGEAAPRMLSAEIDAAFPTPPQWTLFFIAFYTYRSAHCLLFLV